MLVTRQHHQPDILVILGRNVIKAQNGQFLRGYQAGYSHFRQNYDSKLQADGTIAPFPLSDEKIAHLFLERIVDVRCSEQYQAGFLVGWSAALLEEQPGSAQKILAARQTGIMDKGHPSPNS